MDAGAGSARGAAEAMERSHHIAQVGLDAVADRLGWGWQVDIDHTVAVFDWFAHDRPLGLATDRSDPFPARSSPPLIRWSGQLGGAETRWA